MPVGAMPNGLAYVRPNSVARCSRFDVVTGHQAQLAEGVGVGSQAGLVLDAALDEVEHDLRQAALRHALEVVDVQRLVDAHREGVQL
jgi:hypothetical protein